MKTKFRNKNGDLSLYSFFCGYVQSEEKDNVRKELFMEHGTFHVKVYLLSDGVFRDTLAWNSFDSLTESRKNYKSFKVY